MYFLAIRFGVTFSVCIIYKYMKRPIDIHLTTTQRITRYLKGILSLSILYNRNTKVKQHRLSILIMQVTLIIGRTPLNLRSCLDRNLYLSYIRVLCIILIPVFCFNYAIIGHNKEFYALESLKNMDPRIKHPFRLWLRSIEYGKRIKDQIEKTYCSNPMNSHNYGEFDFIPEAMIKKLGEIFMKDE